MRAQKFFRRLHSHFQRFILGVAVDTGRNQRKGNAFAVMLNCQFQAFTVAGNKRFLLTGSAAHPARANGVNDISCWQVVAFGYFCLHRFTAVQLQAFLQKLRPRRFMNSAVHPAATKQTIVGSVNNGINFHFGNIGSNNL